MMGTRKKDLILEREEIFDKDIIDLFRKMKSFRDVLVHKYGEVNDSQAFETIKKGLGDFERIIGEIEGFLDSYN